MKPKDIVMKIEDQIIELTCKYFKTTKQDIKIKTRKNIHIRACVVHAMKRLTNLSLNEIKKYVGCKNHTSVIYLHRISVIEYEDYFKFLANELKMVVVIENQNVNILIDHNKKMIEKEVQTFKREYGNYIKDVLTRYKGTKINDRLIKKITS